MDNDIIMVNEYWKLRKLGPRLYSATRKEDYEHRLYFSRYALERDFGSIIFPSERDGE